jgi:alcohol dehydrogenase class IV
MYEFRWPTKTLVGQGLIEQVGEYVPPSAAANRLLLVAPQEEWAQPLVQRIAVSLREAGWEQVEMFAEVEPNPSWETVTRGAERGKTIGVSAVLAVGGGSPMDAGKVIAERCGAAFLCTVPTTAGTGGEISPWAVISNTETREKDSLMAKWPDVALLDPGLTLSLPPRTTLFTGSDAFIHGLEAYISSAATPITDALAWQGINLVVDNLRTAVVNGDDLSARQAMLEGSLLTGAAMLWAGLGLMHAIGNVTGGLYHELPHGLILMRCMDAVLEFNTPVAGVKFSRIEPLVEQVRGDVEALFAELAVPEVEVAEADLPLLAERAVANVNAKTNPRPATQDDVEMLARQAFVMES